MKERSLTCDLSTLTLEELKEEKERLVKKYIGELDKGVWYHVRLGDICRLILENEFGL